MKKLLKCLCAGLFVVGLAFSGVGCAENKECPKECQKDKCPAPCARKEGAKPCPKAAAAAKQETPAAQPAPAKPAPQGEKK